MTPARAAPDIGKWLDILARQDVAADGPAPVTAPASEPEPGPEPVRPDEARCRMRLLAVPAEDHGPVLATLPDPVGAPERWRALRHCHRALFASAPRAPRETVWPDAPAALGDAGRYFYVHLYLLALPTALERQRRLGVPDDAVAATFADVGAKMAAYRRAHRTGGFDGQRWVMRHFRGTLHRLGRLQFERTTLDATALGGRPGPEGPADGEPVLNVHVPEDGPLPPAACEESLRAARDFSRRHFPEAPFRFATCSSWLLDGQLAAYLPPEANIRRFQERFTRFGGRHLADDDVLNFVFHVPPGTADLDRLPRRTTLHRAVVDHLRADRHWHLVHGWTRLP